MACYVASLHQARLERSRDVFYGIDGETRRDKRLSGRFTFLTVYSNLASDENGEQINYHNSLFLQLTLCSKLSVKAGEDRNGRMLSSGKIRAGGEIRGVKVHVDLAGSCTRHPHLARRARRRGRGRILILRKIVCCWP